MVLAMADWRPGAIMLLIIFCNVFCYIINEYFYPIFEDNQTSKWDGKTIIKMSSFMFIHADVQHLLRNLGYLIISCFRINQNSSSDFWKSKTNFFLFYICSGLFSYLGIILNYLFLQGIMKAEEDEFVNKYNCTYFFCSVINDPISKIRKTLYNVNHFDMKRSLFNFKIAKKIGANGCLAGLLGADIIITIMSKIDLFSFKTDKEKEKEKKALPLDVHVFNVIMLLMPFYFWLKELLLIPLNLTQMKNFTDQLCHTANCSGILFGVVVTSCIILRDHYRKKNNNKINCKYHISLKGSGSKNESLRSRSRSSPAKSSELKNINSTGIGNQYGCRGSLLKDKESDQYKENRKGIENGAISNDDTDDDDDDDECILAKKRTRSIRNKL